MSETNNKKDGLFKPNVNAIPGLYGCEHSGAFFFPQSNHNIVEAQMEQLKQMQAEIDQKLDLLNQTVEAKIAKLEKGGKQ